MESTDGKNRSGVTRDELYELVWSEPMLKVALRFDVSSSYLGRVCTLLNVPRPERGYWAKLAVGKAPAKPHLPEAKPGDETIWVPGGGGNLPPRPLPGPPAPRSAGPSQARHHPTTHPLIVGAAALFEVGKTSSDSEYLRPAKRLLVDLVVTQASLEKSLAFANTLFSALETNGHHVVIASNSEQFQRSAVDEREIPPKKPDPHGRYHLWRPGRITAVYIGTVAIGLTIIEMSEHVEVRYVNGKYIRESEYVAPKRHRYQQDGTWTTHKDFPTGRLCLQAYSPYGRATWVKHWREQKSGLALDPAAIVRDLESSVAEITRLIEEGQRQAEIEHHRWEAQMAEWKRQEEVKRLAKARKDSTDELLSIIEAWAETKRIEAFFSDAEERLVDLPDTDRVLLVERLQQARALIGTADALERFRRWKRPEEH